MLHRGRQFHQQLTAVRGKLPQLAARSATEWDFTGGNIGDDIAIAVAGYLDAGWVVVKRIGLSGNGITDKGANAVARALRANTTVQHIDLSRNDVGVEGARAVADALTVNSTVESLDLRSNRWGVDELLRDLRVDQLLARNKQLRTMSQGPPQMLPQQLDSQRPPAPASAKAAFQGRVNNIQHSEARAVAESSSKATFQAPATPPPAARAAPPLLPAPCDAAHSGQATRHTLGIDKPGYQMIKDFVKDFKPSKLCSRYIAEDCATAFLLMEEKSTNFLPKLVEEAANITASRLEYAEPPAGDQSCAFAIVSYTADLQAFGADKGQNFYVLINRVLQERDMVLLELCQGYLHYLFKGVQALPPLPKQTFYRGLPPDKLGIVQEHYRRTRIIHWSGLSSMSQSEAIAWQFATIGGIVIEVVAFSARSIDHFSAYRGESEALLLPNFRAVVMKELHKKHGRWYLTLEETNEVKPHVF